MKKRFYFIAALFVCCCATPALSQIERETSTAVTVINREMIEKTGRTSIDVLLALPVGESANNYSLGAGIRAGRNFNRSMMIIDGTEAAGTSNQSFIITPEEVEKYGSTSGLLKDIQGIEVIRSGFTAELGYTYLFGKTVDDGYTNYDYDGLSIVHGFGGFRYMPCNRADLQVEAGPALGFFSEGSEFGFGASVNGFFNFTHPAKRIYNIVTTGQKKPELSIGAGVDLFKLNEVDAIILPQLKVRITF